MPLDWFGKRRESLAGFEKTRRAEFEDCVNSNPRSIVSFGSRHPTRSDSAALRRRCTLQFVIDELGNFPAGASCLSRVLRKFNIAESVNITDKLFSVLDDVYDSDKGLDE